MKKLNDICLNITDGTHSTVIDNPTGNGYLLSCKNVKNGHIWITSTDRKIDSNTINQLRKRTKMNIGDVVLTTVGTIGESSVIKCENPYFEFQRSVAVIKPNNEIIDSKYLHYYFISSSGQCVIKSRIKGAAQPCLFLNDLKDIEINLPSIAEQQHIVNIIGSVDDLIENLNKQYQKLLYDSLRLFELFESNQTIYFSDAFKTFNGGTFQSKYYVQESNNKLITIKNVDDAGFNTSSVSYLSDERIDTKYLLHLGDILLTMTGNIGRTGIVDEENCYLNQRVLKLQATSKLYLLCYLIKYKQEIIQLGKGTAQLNLSLEDLNYLVVRNNINEIKKFGKNDVIFFRLLNVKLQIKKLQKIKNFLLLKYF